MFFVGIHLILGFTLLGINVTHGINDQDASFALAIIFHFLNLPTVWALRHAGYTPEMLQVFLVGVVQWAIIVFASATVYHAFKSISRTITSKTIMTAKSASAGDAETSAQEK
jgi:hypothetical protein